GMQLRSWRNISTRNLSAPEDKIGAQRRFSWDDGCSGMRDRYDSAGDKRSLQRSDIAHRKSDAGESRSLGDIRRRDAEMDFEGRGIHDLDAAARRRGTDAARCGAQFPHTGE